MSELTWTQRILDFPVRAAAVDDFLRDLKAKGTGDLNAVLTTLNEGGLCRQAVDFWVGNGWIVLAPDSPIVALIGPTFERELDLHDFCGDAPEGSALEESDAAVGEEAPGPADEEADEETHGDS